MCNRAAAFIGRQMTFGDVGRVLLPIDQNMVPRLVSGRAARRDCGVPFFGSGIGGIYIVHDAAIAIFEMFDHLTNVEFRFVLLHGGPDLWLVNDKSLSVMVKAQSGQFRSAVYSIVDIAKESKPYSINYEIVVWVVPVVVSLRLGLGIDKGSSGGNDEVC